ncbi:MAG: hypothetical protein IJ269_04710, partial [Bacteroidales bacterium]|nr:hypothetical protein [Bacteroidales bacterium]
DGELNDSIYYKSTIDQTISLDVSTAQLDSLIGVMVNCGWIVDSIIPFQNYYSVTLHNLKLNKDSIRSNRERMVSMENSEAVKVWVAPEDGNIEIRSTIHMDDPTGGGMAQSRYADGVKYTVQYDSINYAAIDSSTNVLPRISSVLVPLLTGTLSKHDTNNINDTAILTVNKGDIIYFRLQSKNTNYYDHVLWNQTITYNNGASGTDVYGKVKNIYNSSEDFIVSSDKYFQAVDTGRLALSIYVQVEDTLNKPARLIVYHGSNIKLDTTFSSNIGRAVFNTSFLVGEDDLVKVKLFDDSLSNQTTFGNIVCKPHYTFIPLNSSSIIKDTVEYDIPAYYHVKTNIDSIYTKLFGPLYRGWGQFTYNSDDHDSPINISGYRCLIESDVAIDSTEIASPDNIDTLATSFDNLNAVLDNAGLESVSSNSPFYAMEPSSKHWLWYGPANATLVTSNGMSNTIRTDIFGTMGEDKIVRDCPAPAPTTEYPSVKTHSKTSKSFNFNRNYKASFDVFGNIGYSRNSGHSEIISDFMDMNGDRYPDLIGEGAIQYTKPSGGLGSDIFVNMGTTFDRTSSEGYEKGGSAVVAAYLHNRKGQMANRSEAIGSALDNTSGNYTDGNGESEETLIDVNGDGLPDKIDKYGNVYLNWGYKFIPIPGNWFVGFNRESTFETGGLNYNGNDLFNICQFSVGGGFGINYSHNQTNAMLIDINGDGLPDKVYKDDNNNILVKYNKGNGEWATKIIMGISDIVRSYSLSGSTNISGTAGFTLWGLKMTGTLSGSAFNPSCNIDKVQIADFNNDGLPDFVTSDGIGTIKVRYNQLGGVNLLKKVTNPMGGTIEIDYSLTESSIKNPNRIWVMN